MNNPPMYVNWFRVMIDCKVKNRNFTSALESFDKMPLFDLSSNNPEKISVKCKEILARKNPKSSFDDFITIILDTCVLKCEIFKGLNDYGNFRLWIHEVCVIMGNCHNEMHAYDCAESFLSERVIKATYVTLTMIQSSFDSNYRQYQFKWLFDELINPRLEKSAVHYIEKAMKEYSIESHDVCHFSTFLSNISHQMKWNFII